MTIRKCSRGTKVDTKTALAVARLNMDVNGTMYRTLWLTCPCCGSTLFIKKPAKTRLIK